MSEAQPPSDRDWLALLELAATGANECPWGWDDSYKKLFPDGWGRKEFEAAVNRCYAQLTAEGKLSR